MNRYTNRHYTAVWKKRRKNHLAARCKQAKCPVCSYHKTLGNAKGRVRAKYQSHNDTDGM